jgi:glycosyltransferase involved in cell wall biosynthesis
MLLTCIISNRTVTIRAISQAHAKRLDNSKDTEIGLADCIFAVSDFAANSYRANIDPGKPVKVIPLGVDLDRFKPEPDQESGNFAPQVFTFAFVGSGTQIKAFDLILDAMKPGRAATPPGS